MGGYRTLYAAVLISFFLFAINRYFKWVIDGEQIISTHWMFVSCL